MFRKTKKVNYFYSVWDEPSFVLPDECRMPENAELADALRIFYAAGGYDFFGVVDPEQYSPNWLDFVGALYAEIVDEIYARGEKHFTLPLTAAQKKSLRKQGAPELFWMDI